MPLVYESLSWQHGVFLGATLSSETTAAATGAVGVVRRDPFAMLPFCGYNMGDYFAHWLEVGSRLTRPPRIFRVNWFRRDQDGKLLWPGFGQNLRVLQWVIDRCRGGTGAVESPIGLLPAKGALDLDGLGLDEAAAEKLFALDVEGWKAALRSQSEFLDRFGARMPDGIRAEHKALEARLQLSQVSTSAR